MSATTTASPVRVRQIQRHLMDPSPGCVHLPHTVPTGTDPRQRFLGQILSQIATARIERQRSDQTPVLSLTERLGILNLHAALSLPKPDRFSHHPKKKIAPTAPESSRPPGTISSPR